MKSAPPEQVPLSITWREWLAGPDWTGERYTGEPFDAIVVGSGYGGSVAALRLAQKGHRVLLLERGSEYLPGEFPNDFSVAPKFLRVNVPTASQPMGRASGLVEFHLGDGYLAVSGNGLGGGSLVNAGVAIEPDPDVFDQPDWPAALRHRLDGGLQRHLHTARAMLRARHWDSSLPGGGRIGKTAALERLAQPLRGRPRSLDLTIDPDRCTRCGDCASGCNVPGAKVTLSLTYLAEALATGRVTIVTQAEVYRFAPNAPSSDDHHRWQVHAFATDAQQQFTATAHVQKEAQPPGTWRMVDAPMLFVCAGTLGSTQLLQRSQARSRGRLAFSAALGTRVSGNGDSLSWVVDEDTPMSSVGRGEPGVQAWNALPVRPDEASRIVGPTITAAIDLRDGATEPKALTERLLIEDGAVPRAIAQVARELLATAHTLRQLDDWWFRTPGHAGAAREDPLSASAERAQHSQVLLTMGHDGSPARLVWLDATDRSAPYLPEPDKLDTYAAQQRAFDRLGTRHVHNPLWRPLPRTATQLMDGDLPPKAVTTVHPLGGCVMGDAPDLSVVDDRGRVWVRDPGAFSTPVHAIETDSADSPPYGTHNRPHRYRGLHVLDGAIVPTSLGCNPLLTITALAERAMEAVPARGTARATREPLRSPARAPQAFPSADVRTDAKLHETLVCRDLKLDPQLAATFGGVPLAGRFDATFPTGDFVGAMTDARHRFRIEGTLLIGPQRADAARPPVRYEVRRGRFELLPTPPLSTGPWPLVLAMAQAGAMLLVAVSICRAPGWDQRVARLLLAAALVLLLPFWRSLLTWAVLRGARDIYEALVGGKRQALSPGQLLAWGVSLVKQMVQASEKRVMTYRATLHRVDGPAAWPATLDLSARKRVSYRASLPDVLAWMARRPHTAVDGSTERVPIRETFWEQIMDARVRITRPGLLARWMPVATGRFRMGLDSLLAFGDAHGAAPPPIELGRRGDTSSGLLAAATYPLLFLRFGLKTRILDFRLPNYSGRPLADRIDPDSNAIRGRSGPVVPQLLWVEPVARGLSSNDQGQESTAPVRLSLLRYRVQRPQGLPEIVQARWMGEPVARAKSVLLVHAFGNSGHTFTLQSVPNLAESFHAAGYEVWVLDLRMSTRSPGNAEPSTVDQLAAHDIPAAVDTILARLRQDLGADAPAHPMQIAAFGHCIGSAALWMSLLGGHLSHEPKGRSRRPGGAKLSKLSHAMFSQLHPWVVGARLQQAKTWVPALLQKAWDGGAIPFAVRGPQRGLVLSLMDRFFRSMPAPRAEDRRPGGSDDASATSRRIRYIDAQVFRHEHIADATLGEMNRIFGDANMRLFGHARRFIERGLLVDEDGYNTCVAQDSFRRHASLPVQLLHGSDNQLFDIAGAERTFRRLAAVQGPWQGRYCRDARGAPGFLRVDGYGHLDVLIGKDAHRDVFPHVVGFFDRVLLDPDHQQVLPASDDWVVRPPALGPFVGWTRRRGADVVVRVSFMLDEAGTQAEDKLQVRLRARSAATEPFTTWTGPAVRWHRRQGPFRFFVGDIRLPAGMAVPEDWELLLLRPAWGDPALPGGLQASDAAITRSIHDIETAQAQSQVLPPADRSRIAFDRARFRLPRRTLETLDAGSAFSFAVASCRHPGLGLDRRRIDDPLRRFLHGQDRVAFAALLGDQIYADATAGLVDPLSPLERYHERHEKAFARGRLGDLLASMPVYMTPDDHEWTDNYPAASPIVRRAWPRGPAAGAGADLAERHAAAIATAAIGSFQRLQGPGGANLLRNRGGHRLAAPLPWFRFDHGCARFFVIDSRLTRSRSEPRLVDDFRALERWLRDAAHDERVHVIASGSVVLPGLRPNADPANPGATDTWQYAEAQRRELLELLLAHVRGRFVLLSADYHVSGAVGLEVDGATVGAAIVAPPLYAPLPYANSTPESVFVQERLQLAGDLLTLREVPGGEFARGSGLGVVDLRPAAAGGVDLRYRRRLWVWEEGREARERDALVARLGVRLPVATP